MFRKIRILILLLNLATVALGTWPANSRLTAWEHTVHVAIYPIAADDSPATARFVAAMAFRWCRPILPQPTRATRRGDTGLGAST